MARKTRQGSHGCKPRRLQRGGYMACSSGTPLASIVVAHRCAALQGILPLSLLTATASSAAPPHLTHPPHHTPEQRHLTRYWRVTARTASKYAIRSVSAISDIVRTSFIICPNPVPSGSMPKRSAHQSAVPTSAVPRRCRLTHRSSTRAMCQTSQAI
jgi:hypothetical protein